MFISQIKIKKFRNFKSTEVLFNPGLNILIGHNNSGKTNLIKALQLVFDRSLKDKPTIDDFCKIEEDYSTPPSIEISAFISEHNDKPDDKNVVYDWLIQDSPNYMAQLTYLFELPTKHVEDYLKQIEKCRDNNGKLIQDECLKLISKKFLSKYVSHIYGGLPSKQEKVDSENLDKFDFQFLTAIRDAERQMFFGNNTLLRDVLNYFLDYDLTNGQGFESLTEDLLVELKTREDEFKVKSRELLEVLINRIDRDKILQYSKDTGADSGGKPNFDAEITEQDLLFALRLIVEKSGFKIPIKNNGLGYNNLLFIALILAKMQMECSAYMGDNAKVYPILAIEEPEAHLHPSMQSKFLKFLNKNLNTNEQVRQIFVTSHSTHITSAVDLDSIICLYKDLNENYRVGYPSKVFTETVEDKSSKIYVQRFLDATKSNMLFADRLIFVEGLAEQLLIPCLAEYLQKEDELIDKHVSIISVDSRTFKHFLKIFAYNPGNNPNAINKKVVCITDADPTIKRDNRWISTFPFNLDETENSKSLSSHVEYLETEFEDKYDNIEIFHPFPGIGKSFEYEIAKENPTSELLITDSFPKQNSAHSVENFKAILGKHSGTIQELIQEYQTKLEIDDPNENKILEGISKCSWDENDRKNGLIAAIYYKIVGEIKGEHAFYLSQNLRENYKKPDGERLEFHIPLYIEDAIDTILTD
jgi:putative ATP-dependent endonuclease of the OLD family